MEGQNKLLMILSVVFLVLVGGVWLTNDKKPKDVSGDEPAARALVELKSEDVTTLKLTSASGVLRFEKDGQDWKIKEPKEVPIDTFKVREIVDRLDGLEAQEEPLNGKKEDFGLTEKDWVKVELTSASGATKTLFVGKDTSVGYRTYVQEAQDGPSLLATSRIGDLVHRTLDDFRARDVWAVSSAMASRVQIEQPGAAGQPPQVVLLKRDTHGWWLGDGARAEEKAVEAWLAQAEALRLDSFVDAPPAASEVPSARVVVEDPMKSDELKIYGLSPEGATVVGPIAAGRVGGAIQQLLQPQDWRAKSLVPVRVIQVDRAALKLGDQARTIEKKDDIWKDADGKSALDASEWLDRIAAVPADRTQAPPELGAEWGSLVLSEGTSRTEKVVFGQALPGGLRAAKDDAGGPVFTVKEADLLALFAPPPATPPEPPPGALSGMPPGTPLEAPPALDE